MAEQKQALHETLHTSDKVKPSVWSGALQGGRMAAMPALACWVWLPPRLAAETGPQVKSGSLASGTSLPPWATVSGPPTAVGTDLPRVVAPGAELPAPGVPAGLLVGWRGGIQSVETNAAMDASVLSKSLAPLVLDDPSLDLARIMAAGPSTGRFCRRCSGRLGRSRARDLCPNAPSVAGRYGACHVPAASGVRQSACGQQSPTRPVRPRHAEFRASVV